MEICSLYYKNLNKITSTPIIINHIKRLLKKLFLFLFALINPGKIKVKTNNRYTIDKISSFI